MNNRNLIRLRVYGRLKEIPLLDLPFWIDENQLKQKKHFASYQ